MAKVKRETCLWILPVRFAVFIISFLVTAVSAILIALTFLHRNAMMVHLAVIHSVLPWVYIIVLGVSGVVGLFGMLATVIGNHGFMVFYKTVFWLMTIFIVIIWQLIVFILALTHRPETTDACNLANPQQVTKGTTTTNFTMSGYTTTIMGFNEGNTYGFANCGQAVQAGVVGLAILLFIGGIFMTWFAFTVNKCVRNLDTSPYSRAARTAQWDDNLDSLQSSYAQDRKNAPQYPMGDLNKKQSAFSRGLMKLKLKK